MVEPEPKTNISPEIEAALAEGREAGLREAAAYIRGLKEVFVPWFFRGMNGVPEVGPDGWGEMLDSQKRLLQKAARGIDRLINNESVPEHQHVWGDQGDGTSTCFVCGEDRDDRNPT